MVWGYTRTRELQNLWSEENIECGFESMNMQDHIFRIGEASEEEVVSRKV